MHSLLPSTVQVPHILALELLMKQRLDQLEIDALLIYLIDTVNVVALESLARQFDLLGYKGWRLADTEDKKRALIKKAIELHRFKGTIWAIKEALRTLGFPNVIITEHVTHWAGFTIQLNAGSNPVSIAMQEQAVKLINEYKNVRSHLLGLEWIINESDNVELRDESYEATGEEYKDDLFIGSDFLYNGEHLYDGSKNYSADTDVLELIIS